VTPVWRRRTTKAQWAIWLAWLVGALAFAQSWHFISEATLWDFVWDAPTQAGDMLGRMFPPRWSYATKIVKPLWDTVNIATLGTLLAILLATPVAFLAARNTSPNALLLRPLALGVIAVSRSINTLIWALLLVTIVGPGVLAGILSVALHSIGFFGKLLYEAIEEIDPTQTEAIAATGASRSQILAYGVVPQVMPTFAGVSVYRWDINIRESAVLGIVGAGGIGLQLNASVSQLAWPQVTLILIAILGAVVVSEWVSAKVRAAIV
jgi:phosphonate transport system permease protein